MHFPKNLSAILVLGVSLVLITGAFQLASAYSATLYSNQDPLYSYSVEYDDLDDLPGAIAANPPGDNLSFDQDADEFDLYSNAGGTVLVVSAEAGSSDITLYIPELGYTKVFAGADRGAALADMQTWADNDPDGIVARVRAAAEPFAGTGIKTNADGGCFLSTLK